MRKHTNWAKLVALNLALFGLVTIPAIRIAHDRFHFSEAISRSVVVWAALCLVYGCIFCVREWVAENADRVEYRQKMVLHESE